MSKSCAELAGFGVPVWLRFDMRAAIRYTRRIVKPTRFTRSIVKASAVRSPTFLAAAKVSPCVPHAFRTCASM